jgi:hypothetical protein
MAGGFDGLLRDKTRPSRVPPLARYRPAMAGTQAWRMLAAYDTLRDGAEIEAQMAMGAYEPYTPLNTLKQVAPDIWVVDGPEIRFGLAGFKLAHPTRMTIVRLPQGGLWLHSPTPPTTPLVRSLEQIGPVEYLIAPNNFHYWWIADWEARFPNAAAWGPPGLQQSAKRALPPLRTLEDTPAPDWALTLDQFVVRGNLFAEVVFFHRPTRTLILTDLIENFESSRVRNRWARRLLLWSGVADQDGRPPLDMRLAFLRRRRTLRAAVCRMIDWSPERVILAHGRWFQSNGAAELRRVFGWILRP